MKKLLIILLSVLSLTVFAQDDVKRVAILETVDKMGTVPYLKQLMFRSNLTTAITNTAGYEGYDRADLKEILGEQNFQRTGLVSDNDIKKIGEFTGAQYVLIAEATIDGSDMFITAKIIDVETARVIKNSNQLMGTSASEMQDGSQKVAADLLGASSPRTASSTSHNSNSSNAASYSVNSKVETPANTTPVVKSSDGYVDLGLPSGTLWKEKNEECGLVTHEKAMSLYGAEIPTLIQIHELITQCIWTSTKEGFIATGPNKVTIYFPIAGYKDLLGAKYKNAAVYWSSTPADNINASMSDKEKERTGGFYGCLFFMGKKAMADAFWGKAGGSVRLVK